MKGKGGGELGLEGEEGRHQASGRAPTFKKREWNSAARRKTKTCRIEGIHIEMRKVGILWVVSARRERPSVEIEGCSGRMYSIRVLASHHVPPGKSFYSLA